MYRLKVVKLDDALYLVMYKSLSEGKYSNDLPFWPIACFGGRENEPNPTHLSFKHHYGTQNISKHKFLATHIYSIKT